MRRNLGRRGFAPRRRLPTTWTGQQLSAEATVAAAAQTDIIIVAPSDYAHGTVAGNTEPGGTTLLRVVGDVSLRATVIGGLAYMALYVAGIGESITLNSGADVISGDVLWQDMVMVPIDTNRQFHIDTKVRRKLENDSIVFSIRAVAQTVTYAGQWRALLRGAG